MSTPLQLSVIAAQLTYSDEDKYVGFVRFAVEGHLANYELTLLSKNNYDWQYSLTFYGQSGKEEEIDLVEQQIENDDDLFDSLIEAAQEKLEK